MSEIVYAIFDHSRDTEYFIDKIFNHKDDALSYIRNIYSSDTIIDLINYEEYKSSSKCKQKIDKRNKENSKYYCVYCIPQSEQCIINATELPYSNGTIIIPMELN